MREYRCLSRKRSAKKYRSSATGHGDDITGDMCGNSFLCNDKALHESCHTEFMSCTFIHTCAGTRKHTGKQKEKLLALCNEAGEFEIVV